MGFFGGVIEGYNSVKDRKRKDFENKFEQAKSMAALQEAGFDYNPQKNTLSRTEQFGQVPEGYTKFGGKLMPDRSVGYQKALYQNRFGGNKISNIGTLQKVLSETQPTEEPIPGSGMKLGLISIPFTEKKKKVYSPENAMLRNAAMAELGKFGQGGQSQEASGEIIEEGYQDDGSDPVADEGLDQETNRRVGRTQSGRIVYLD